MLRKGKGKPKKLKLTEDQLTTLLLQQALYNPHLIREQRFDLLDGNLKARKAREQPARKRVKRDASPKR